MRQGKDGQRTEPGFRYLLTQRGLEGGEIFGARHIHDPASVGSGREFGIDRSGRQGSMGAGEDVPRGSNVFQDGGGLRSNGKGGGSDQSDVESEPAAGHI